ncbi:MAG: DUF559 domain-containing protein [Actinomycetota bacterium]|nr:DUF559 domain-containing protein [Actinomycetota bacterium]
MLDVEADSFKWHGNRHAWARDQARDRALRSLGWEIYRFTWDEYRADRVRVIDEIRDILLPRLRL